MENKVTTISNIIKSVKGKNIISKRIEALKSAGYAVHTAGIRWNFGTSGTVKEEGGDIIAQLKCAHAGRAKNGYSLNACEVYRIN